MIRATIEMKIKAGREGEFENAWEAIAGRVRSIPGNRRQELLRDPKNPSSYVLTSDWDTAEEFHAFERSTEQDELTRPLRDLRESSRMMVYSLIKHVEGA